MKYTQHLKILIVTISALTFSGTLCQASSLYAARPVASAIARAFEQQRTAILTRYTIEKIRPLSVLFKENGIIRGKHYTKAPMTFLELLCYPSGRDYTTFVQSIKHTPSSSPDSIAFCTEVQINLRQFMSVHTWSDKEYALLTEFSSLVNQVTNDICAAYAAQHAPQHKD